MDDQKPNENQKHENLRVVLSSGPIEATPNTEMISVNILNVDEVEVKEIIIEIKDWTNSPPIELGKFIYINGEQINPCDLGYCEENDQSEVFDPTIFPGDLSEDGDSPITKPFYFQLPAQMQLTVLADFPQAPILFANPCYEVRIYLPDSENLLVSSFGLNYDFEPQAGNTILNHQFYPPSPLSIPFPKRPFS